MSMLSLTFEAVVAFALVAAAILCWRLDRRLSALKSGQDGVRQAVIELAEATARAQASVRDLRQTSEDAGRDLSAKIAAARAVADELNILGAAGARRIRDRADVAEEGAEPARKPRAPNRRRAALGPQPARDADPMDDDEARAQAEALLGRLRGVR
jgi:hypothetical protein